MSIIDFLKKGGKTTAKEMINGIAQILGIQSEEEMAQLWQAGVQKYGSEEALGEAVETAVKNVQSEEELKGALASVFMPEESQMFKCGGKLQQLTAKFAKGGKAVDCGCNGTKLQNGDKIRKGQDGLQAHADNLDKLGMTRSAAIARGFKSSPDVEEQVVITNNSTPDKGIQLTRRQARDLAKENRGYNNDQFITAYINMKDALRRENPELRGKALRQQARYIVSGLRAPIESIPNVTDNITAGPIVMENPKNVTQDTGVLDLSGHNIGIVDDAAINNALAKAVVAGRAGSGQARRDALGSRYAAVQALVNKGVSRPTGIKPVAKVVKDESTDTSSVQKEVPVSSESEQIILRPGVDSVNVLNENPKTPRYDGSGYADFVPAAEFNPRYAFGNWGVPYSDSIASRELLRGRAGRWLQKGGIVKNQVPAGKLEDNVGDNYTESGYRSAVDAQQYAPVYVGLNDRNVNRAVTKTGRDDVSKYNAYQYIDRKTNNLVQVLDRPQRAQRTKYVISPKGDTSRFVSLGKGLVDKPIEKDPDVDAKMTSFFGNRKEVPQVLFETHLLGKPTPYRVIYPQYKNGGTLKCQNGGNSSIWEQISNPRATYTDGYGVEREVYEPKAITAGRKVYNAINTVLNGSDSELSDEEYLQKHGFNRPATTTAPLPTINGITLGSQLKKVANTTWNAPKTIHNLGNGKFAWIDPKTGIPIQIDAIKDINVPINSKLGKITIGNLVDKIYSPRTAAGVVGGGLAGAALGSYLMSDKENK